MRDSGVLVQPQVLDLMTLEMLYLLEEMQVLCTQMTLVHRCGTVCALISSSPEAVFAPWVTTAPRDHPNPSHVTQENTVKHQGWHYPQETALLGITVPTQVRLHDR